MPALQEQPLQPPQEPDVQFLPEPKLKEEKTRSTPFCPQAVHSMPAVSVCMGSSNSNSWQHLLHL